jgi:hypothetical protein
MATLRQPGCDCPGRCTLDETRSGGESGLSETFALGADGAAVIDCPSPYCTLHIEWDFISIKDRLELAFAGLPVTIDTGCVSGTGSDTRTVSNGATNVTVTVTAHCDPGEPGTTEWSFRIWCEPLTDNCGT